MPFRHLISMTLLTGLSMLSACTPSQDTSSGTSTGKTTAPPNAGVPATATVGDPPQSDRSQEVELTVADLAQLSEIIKSHAGKVVVVDVWSTSCAPCMREFPHLVALSKNTESDKLACISLNVDYIGLKSKPPESYLGKVQEFLQQQQADQVTNLLSAATDEAVLSEFQLVSIPAILIYSVDGNLKHALTDANTGEDGLSYEGDVIPMVTALLAAQ
ncbi:MAG: TlpA family protein disulfide reductase [Pirellulaceae bacterium]|jgi:thiol-disulfide isomerase/thioredoxin|nr:TlpA family protein disulfide reductase [Pirellulaceae bacterium]